MHKISLFAFKTNVFPQTKNKKGFSFLFEINFFLINSFPIQLFRLLKKHVQASVKRNFRIVTCLFPAQLIGDWQDAPLYLLGNKVNEFEQGLFYYPLVGDELRSLGCIGDYIEALSINIQNEEEIVFEVFCDGQTSWVYVDSLPPTKVETFHEDPTTN